MPKLIFATLKFSGKVILVRHCLEGEGEKVEKKRKEHRNEGRVVDRKYIRERVMDEVETEGVERKR